MGEPTTKNKTKKYKVLCAECSRETNHKVLESKNVEGTDKESPIFWWDDYQIIQCQGCTTVSFRHLSYFSEHDDRDNSSSDGKTEYLYPKRDEAFHRRKDFRETPEILRRIYHETIESFNNECFTLCAAGLRGLVEGLCANKSVKSGIIKDTRKRNLEGKIAGLCEKGFLTKSHANILHKHRHIGNDAMHKLAQPSRKELRLAIEIIEHTLEHLYEIPKKGVELKRNKKRRKEIFV